MNNTQGGNIRSELLELGFDARLEDGAFTNSSSQPQQAPIVGADLSKVNLLTDLQLLGISQQAVKDGGEEEGDSEGEDWEEEVEYHKMVFLVRMDLKMSVGKIASQTGHAVMGAYRKLEDRLDSSEVEYTLQSWEDSGCPKIVLKVESKQQMLDLEKKANDAGINTYLVCDSPKDKKEELGNITVCAIGPAKADDIDAITKHLRLLS